MQPRPTNEGHPSARPTPPPPHQRRLAHAMHQAQQVLVAHAVQRGDDQLGKAGALHARGVLPARDALPPVLPPPAGLVHQELEEGVALQHLAWEGWAR